MASMEKCNGNGFDRLGFEAALSRVESLHNFCIFRFFGPNQTTYRGLPKLQPFRYSFRSLTH